MKKKAFTLIELLVVIAIIALLMGILMPALATAKNKAMILVCRANLSGLGKAMLVYAHDNKDNLPRAGGPQSIWDATGCTGGGPTNWSQPGFDRAFGITPRSPAGSATVTSSIYLLVRGGNMTPAQAVCKSDGAREFKVSLELPAATLTLEQVWDFGCNPPTNNGATGIYCSYAYQMPYVHAVSGASTSFAIDDTYNPDTPVLADRNPHLDKRRPTPASSRPTDLKSFSHGSKGQNVWFKNGSADWSTGVGAGIGGNNIYAYGTNDTVPVNIANPTGAGSVSRQDVFLVSERNAKILPP